MRYCYHDLHLRHCLKALGGQFFLFGGYIFVYLSGTVRMTIEGIFCSGQPSNRYHECRDVDLLSNSVFQYTHTHTHTHTHTNTHLDSRNLIW